MHRSEGVSLIETLIALLVVGVGLATLATVSGSLSRNAETARQRSEATQLARERLESWRAFEQVATAAAGPALAYADIASGSDMPSLASPTRYSRSWSVTVGPDDAYRLLSVRVSWAHRSDTGTSSVALATLLSRSAPAHAGSIALPAPANEAWRRPRDRSSQIPFEATQLAGANRGESSLAWDASATLVFDDNTGRVVARCGSAVSDATALATSCVSMQGYLLEGYIGGALPADPAAIGIVFDRLAFLAAGTSPQCVVGPAIDSRSGNAIPGLRRYRCLIQPSDHDANPSTPPVWSGRVRLAGLPVGSIGCRYRASADASPTAEYPGTYSMVASSLSQHNFFIASSAPCPTGTVAPDGGN